MLSFTDSVIMDKLLPVKDGTVYKVYLTYSKVNRKGRCKKEEGYWRKSKIWYVYHFTKTGKVLPVKPVSRSKLLSKIVFLKFWQKSQENT